MIIDATALEERNEAVFGFVTTVMFVVFFIMHISLSIVQYNIAQMNKFNQAVTYSLFPDVDVNVPLSPK